MRSFSLFHLRISFSALLVRQSASGVDLKLVLLGHKAVGKTSIFNRYIYDDFGKTTMTIGAYFAMKQCRVDNKNYNLAIWDTAGEEKFDSLTNFYCRGARAALICYEITNYESFAKLPRWVDKITLEAEPNCAIIIVGNKYDLAEQDPTQRKVEFSEAKRFAKSINAEAYESSAATGMNINEIFQKLVVTSLERFDPHASSQDDTVGFNKKQHSGGCSC